MVQSIYRLAVWVALLLCGAGHALAGPFWRPCGPAVRLSDTPLTVGCSSWASWSASEPVLMGCCPPQRWEMPADLQRLEAERFAAPAKSGANFAPAWAAGPQTFDLNAGSQRLGASQTGLADLWTGAALSFQGYQSGSTGLLPNAFTGLDAAALFASSPGRGLVASPASFSASAARGGIMMIRWQSAIPPAAGAMSAAGVAGAAAAPLAGGPALAGLGAGAGQLAGLAAFAGPAGFGPDFGPIPDPLSPPWPGGGGIPGGGGFPGGGGGAGGVPDGSDPDDPTPPDSVVVVPEPATFFMAAAGMVGLLIRGRRGSARSSYSTHPAV